MPFIKILYEGVKLQSLSIGSQNTLYRGSILSNKEILKIQKYLNNKIKDLPGAIVFSKTFLSFSKDEKIAKNFLNSSQIKGLSKVLFILEKDESLDNSLSTHSDIENISFFPEEKEVLFFPFSSFEIKGIKETNYNNEKIYEIKLLYLGKYIKEFQKDKTLIENEKTIPNSKFKKQLVEFGIIKKEKINMNKKAKQILINYEKYKKDINNYQIKNNLSGINNNDLNEINKIGNNNNYCCSTFNNFYNNNIKLCNISEEGELLTKKVNLDINSIFQSEDFIKLSSESLMYKYKYLDDKNLEKLKLLKDIYNDLILGEARLNNKLLDIRGNKIEGWSINEARGNKLYDPPLGWIGFGIKCKNKYEDDIWIGNNNSIGEWSVAYHGVARGQDSHSVKKIIGIIIKSSLKPGWSQVHQDCEDQFHPGKRVGIGVYCSSKISYAELYSGISKINGISYKTVLMLRVRPDAIRGCKDNPDSLVVNGVNDEIRIYRILYKKLDD